MSKSKFVKVAAVLLGVVLMLGAFTGCNGCKKGDKTLIIMSEELNGLFNPFFSTSGSDMDVIGQTQLGMLSTDAQGGIAYGDDEAVVVKDYKKTYNDTNDTTTYEFVLKNGIVFSDGKPLTMNDVLFNMYVYLDPSYTGSTTMYSTDIVGLQRYRTQRNVSGDGTSESDSLNESANGYARARTEELVNLFWATGKTANAGTYDADEAKMRAAIDTWSIGSGYTDAIGETDTAKARAQLKADYENAIKLFREELENDYNGAKDSFVDSPYKETGEFDEITSFMYVEGYVTLEYDRDANGKYDRSKIKKVTRDYSTSVVKDKESAINYVYDAKVSTEFHNIVRYWGTANTLNTEFVAKAKEVILHKNLKDGELVFPNIEGIKSLGHQAATKGSSLVIGDKTYTVASAHNADGTVADNSTYDVLSITINGVDPKAIWNFGFTVAPHHYYSDKDKYPVDIENNKFGVEWSTFDFMKNVIQGVNSWGASKNKIPLGAGPYMATDSKYRDKPDGSGFYHNNIVYYKANHSFLLGAPKIEKMSYQVVSSTNALGVLQSGSVHYVTPQFTKENAGTLDAMTDKGFESIHSWQLGYGYIGINAGKVPDLDLRKAIMSAMQTELATNYYSSGTAVVIHWPMSLVSWAYPRRAGTEYDPANPIDNQDTNNGHDYMQWSSAEAAKTKIRSYMSKAGASEGDSRLKLKFTIAGSNLTEHPTYLTFKQAADLLNECGWDVEVSPDTNALTKLATGSLSVWAAAWSSTIDPDMYQVYHKNSSATSVLAWGYRDILSDKQTYSKENTILTNLSKLITDARETDDQTVRTDLYKDAMGYVLDLAVEMPCYQRQVLYAYNAKVIKKDSMPKTVNPYTSPLAKIWEIEFA